MPQSKYTDDALRKVGRNIVNFQKLEHALRGLIRLSSSTASKSNPLLTFPRHTKRLQRTGLAEVVDHFNRVLYSDASPTESSDNEMRVSNEFRLELDSNAQVQRKELAALARERNRLVHRELFAFDFASEPACLELCDRLDSQNLRILGYLEFVRSVRDTHALALRSLLEFVESDEFLSILASDESDA
jgi:hypothetical protein